MGLVSRFFSFYMLVLILGCSIPIDPGMSAFSGGEPTIIFEGCNRKLSKGYLFCETQQASNPTLSKIKLIVPVVSCNSDHCIEYRFIKPDGNFSAQGAIPKGVGEISLPLSAIVGSDSLLSGSEEGEYLLQMRVFFEIGKTQETEVIFGYLRLKIWDQHYAPMGCGSPYKAMTTVISKNCEAQYSSKLRLALCGCPAEGG